MYFVTAIVPSETACLASSPGKTSRTLVWISLDPIVAFSFVFASFPAWSAIL